MAPVQDRHLCGALDHSPSSATACRHQSGLRRKGIYVSSQNTMWIEGMERSESEALLNQLFDRVEDPDIIYEHIWEVGDLIMWDNLSCLHARTDWPRSNCGSCVAAPLSATSCIDAPNCSLPVGLIARLSS